MKWYEHTVKNDLAVPHCFVKLFHLQQSCGILDSTRWHNSIARIRSKRFLFIWSEKRFLFYKLFTTNPQEESYLPNWLSIFHMLVEEILSPTPFFFFYQGFSFTDTDDSQDSRGREGTSFIPLYHFHPLTNIQIFICYRKNIYRLVKRLASFG